MGRLFWWGLVLGLSSALAQSAGEIRGAVVDARGGEALSNVTIQIVGGAWRATTDAAGQFAIPAVTPGDYMLQVSTVGHHF